MDLYVGSTNLIKLTGLMDTTDSSYPTTAGVSCTLKDTEGNVVVGAEAITMSYVSPTTGASTLYRGTLPASLPLLPLRTYVATVTVTDASANVRIFTLNCTTSAG